MGSRKLVRDFFLTKQIVFLRPQSSIQTPNLRLPSFSANGYSNFRRFGVFNEFSKQVKGEAKSNTKFQQSIKELKDKAEELKEVKEDLKVRTKKKTKQIYKHVDGVWTEAEATAKKVSANVKEKISAARVEVSANVKEKISAARVEVKETFGFGKQESSGSTSTSGDSNATHAKDEAHTTSGAETKQGPESSSNQEAPGASETLFGRFKSSVTSTSPKVSMAFQKLKDAKLIELAKKGYDIIKDELDSNPRRRKRVERSSATGIVVVPTTRWDAFKEKVQNNPIFKRISGISEPVVNKGQELAEDVREIWETSGHPVVHKIQDLNETVFGETATALSFKEIRRRDPSFSLPDFVAEVQEMIRPTLDAYLKGDMETLKKNCSPEVIERCKAERSAYESQGIFFDNKILHIADIEVRESKMMGTTPIIIVAFQTQQVYCVRDRNGSITEGGKDTIHTVYYAWAMQQLDPEELSEDAFYPVWRLREMQQLGFQALI